MFYKFNSISGRVAPSTQSAAYNPQGIRPFEDRPAFFQFDQKNTRPVTSEARSTLGKMADLKQPKINMSTAAAGTTKPLGFIPSNPKYQRIIELQKKFSKNDGVLVWLKMGGRDKALVGLTVACCIAGFASGFSTLYDMARKKN
ncbi:cytochrome c oxidase subunit 7A2-like, mitochondrial [Tubulanus polymorphus]|uniref:cytochrome c oxidase subunit 7A2-like, mitochondrial n=1 Tax=Tubulanus polymorphus TaxID=672921 RepID=UPI003DA425BB